MIPWLGCCKNLSIFNQISKAITKFSYTGEHVFKRKPSLLKRHKIQKKPHDYYYLMGVLSIFGGFGCFWSFGLNYVENLTNDGLWGGGLTPSFYVNLSLRLTGIRSYRTYLKQFKNRFLLVLYVHILLYKTIVSKIFILLGNFIPTIFSLF